MRTTVTLDDDLVAAVNQAARERGSTFKEVVNAAVRQGLRAGSAPAAGYYRFPVFDLGVRPGIDVDKALAVANDLEDDEILRKLDLRK